ncbi:MAG: PQQ-binding-like beta-propeller repeat protein, partial [Ilumatobacter sp.]
MTPNDEICRPDDAAATPVAPIGDRREVRSISPADESTPSPWSAGSGATFSPTVAPRLDVADSEVVARTVPAVSGVESPVRHVTVDGEVVAFARRPNRRRIAVAAMVAAVAAVVAVLVVVRAVRPDGLDGDVTTGLSDEWIYPNFDGVGDVVVASGALVDPLVDEPFAGADRRRLPARLDERWSTEVVDVDVPSGTDLTVLDDGSVIGVFDDRSVDAGEMASVVVALDTDDGSELWRSRFESSARDLTVVAAFDGVVVMQRRSSTEQSLLGLAAATGDVLWADETDGSVSHSVVPGTSLVARDSSADFPPLGFIDPVTGAEVGRPDGRPFAVDSRGAMFFRNGRDVSRLDLRDGWSPPVPVGELPVDGPAVEDAPASVVDGRLVVIVDGDLHVRGDDGTPRRAEIVGADPGDGPVAFTELVPIGDDAVVLLGGGDAFGADLLDDGDVDIRWRASGTPISFRSTDRGATIVMATEGGGEQRVIDGSTGQEITSVDMVPGAIDTLQLVGNGVVVKRSATVGTERVGLDLDGDQLWTLVG